MEREERLLHLHTDGFLLFLCALCLNLNRPTCASTLLFNTSVLSFSPFFFISLLRLSPAPSLHICTQHTEQSPQATITPSLYRFIYSITYLSRSLSSHIIVYCVYVCGYNTPRGTILRRHWHVVDISAQFTGFLWLQCLTVFTSTPIRQCVRRRYYACLDYMFSCVCAGHKRVSLYAFFHLTP